MGVSDDTTITNPQPTDALRAKLEAFRQHPRDARLYRELRDALRQRGQHRLLAELSELHAPHERDPQHSAEVWAEAAHAWFATNAAGQAERALQRALSLDPGHERAAAELTELYLKQSRYAEAADLMEDELEELEGRDDELARRVTPEDDKERRAPHIGRRAERHRALAQLFGERLSRVDRALHHWQKAWNLEPERTDALEAARSLYASLGDEKMVARLYEAELDVLGDSGPRKRRSELQLELGRIAARQGESMAAANHFELALRLDSSSMAAREALADIYASTELAAKADRQRRASELLVELGMHRLDSHEEEAGVTFLRRALGVDPYSQQASDALEHALAQAERWEELDRLYRQRLELTDDAQERIAIQRKRADLYESQLSDRAALREILVELAAQSRPHGDISQRLRALYRESEDWQALAKHIEAELPAIQSDRERTSAEMLELATIVREHLGERERAAAILHGILQHVDSGNEEALVRYADHFRERRDWRGLADLLDFAVDNARDAGVETSELVRQLEEIAQIAEMRLGDIDRAMKTWQRIQELEPDSPKPAEAIRRLMSRAKMWESLVGVLEQEAQAAQTPEQRAEALRRIAQVYRERQVNPRRAIALYEEVVQLFPDDRGALKALGELYERDGDQAGLASTMRRQLEFEARAMGATDVQQPNAREWPMARRSERLTALRRLMTMYDRLADTQGVVYACTGILEILPGDRDALDRMERALEKSGDTKRLEQTLEYHASSASGPAERSKVLRRLARIALQTGDEVQAMERWENLLTAAPNDAEALEKLSHLYERHNRDNELATVLERMLMPHRRSGPGAQTSRRPKTEPGTRTRPIQTSSARQQAGGHDRGQTGSVLTTNVPDIETRVAQLRRYAKVVDDKLGDPVRAIRAWELVLDLAGNDREAIEALARLYEAHGHFSELAEVLGKQAGMYREFDPFEGAKKGAKVALKRAQLLDQRLGAATEAIKALEHLLAEFDPSNLEAHQTLRRLYEAQGDFESAVRIAEREMYLTADPAEKMARGLEIGALCRDRISDPHRALQAFERVLALKADHHEALEAAVELYAQVEDWESHLHTLEELAAFAPEGNQRRDLYLRIAHVTAERIGDHQGAFGWYRKAYEHAPDESTLAELRRAAEQYGLWKELAEVYDQERGRLEVEGKPRDPDAYVAVCQELAAISERELGDPMRAMNVLYDAIAVQPRDSRLMAEAERLARDANDQALWNLLLECMEAALEGADRAGRAALHMRRARVHEEHLDNTAAAFEELLKAFAWIPDNEEIRKALHELAERAGQWDDVIAAESALLERASTPRARLAVLRRKAAVLEDRLTEPVRAFRTHLIAFLLAPADNDTVSHLWRLAREIGAYKPADQTPRAEPPAAYVHPPEPARNRAAQPSARASSPAPGHAPAGQAPQVEVRSSAFSRADATMDLSVTDLQALGMRGAAPVREDHTMDLSLAELRNLRVKTSSDALFDRGGGAERDGRDDAEGGRAGTRPGIDDVEDATIELSVNDLMVAMSGEKPARAGSPRPPAPPPLLPGVSSRRPPPPPPPRPRTPAPTPPPPRLAPLPQMPARAYQSPWEEMAAAYELLAAPSPEARQRCLFRVAEIWENGAGEIIRAFNTLARALDLGVDDTEARARLQRLATEHDSWDELAELFETAAEEAKTAGRAVSLLMDVAEIRARQQRGRETEAIYRRVLGMRPDDIEVRRRLEELYRTESRWVDLAACLEERTDPRLGAAAPDSERPTLLRELADLYNRQLNRPHDAIDALHRLQALVPEDVDVLLELGRLYSDIGRWSKVIEMLNRVGEVAEGTPAARDALRRIAQIYQTELELPDRAIVAYSQLVTAWPDDSEAHAALDKLYEAHARWEELAEILRRRAALSRDPEQRAHLLRRRAAVLMDYVGEAEEAAGALRHARTITPDAPGLADELIRALIAAGREREAASVLEGRIAAHRDAGTGEGESAGNIAALMIRLATLKAERLGDSEGAKQYLHQALRLVPQHPTALATLSKIVESEEDPRTYAQARLREAEALSDVDAKVEALMKAGVTLRDRCADIDGARLAFEQVLQVRPYHPDATWSLAGLVAQGGDPNQAAHVLQTRLEDESLDSAEKARILTQLAALARQTGIEAAAERHLLDALEADPGHLPAIIARADLLAEGERFEDLQVFLCELLPGLEDAPPATLAELHRRLAVAYEQLGREDEAYQTLLDADRLHRNNLLVKFALGENRYRARRWREAALHLGSLAIHLHAKDHPAEVAEGLYHAALAEIRSLRPEKARALYERAIDLKPTYAPALHALAEIAMEEGNHDKAADFLTRQASATEDPAERLRLFEALGDMALATLDDPERALECYECAVAAASPLESRHLPLLHKLLERQDLVGDHIGAARTGELMASFATDNAERAAHYTAAAENYMAGKDPERARAAAERAVEADPYDLIAVNLLSGLYMARGAIEEASGVLGRALSGRDAREDDEIVAARKSQLWNRLGHARKGRGDINNAAAAWEKSIALAPDSDSSMDSRRELLQAWKDEPQKRDALLDYRRVLAADSMNLKDVVNYARALCQARRDDGGRAILELSALMGHDVAKLDQGFLDRRPVYQMAADEAYRRPLTEAQHAELVLGRSLGAADEDSPEKFLAGLLSALWEAASLLWSEPEEGLERSTVAGAAKVHAFSDLAVSAMFPCIATALNVPVTVLYTTSLPDAPDIQVVCVSPPIVVVGPRLQVRTGHLPASGTNEPSETELRFHLGRAAEMARPEHIIAAGLPYPDFVNLIGSVLRCFAPKHLKNAVRGDILDEDVQRAHDEHLRTTLPVKLRGQLEAMLEGASSRDVDPDNYLDALVRSADRAGFLMCGDVATAAAHAACMSADGRRIHRHLIETALKPTYLDARATLGVGVREPLG
jgi:tetratricopeptide (TPR) repeat protein